MVNKFGYGRVFIVGGDAHCLIKSDFAHYHILQTQLSMLTCRLTWMIPNSHFSVHSPTGGQGLNACVQDAVSFP